MDRYKDATVRRLRVLAKFDWSGIAAGRSGLRVRVLAVGNYPFQMSARHSSPEQALVDRTLNRAFPLFKSHQAQDTLSSVV